MVIAPNIQRGPGMPIEKRQTNNPKDLLMKTCRRFVFPIMLMSIFAIVVDGRSTLAQFGSKAVPVPSKNLRIKAAVKKGEIKGALVLEWSLNNISRKNITF